MLSRGLRSISLKNVSGICMVFVLIFLVRYAVIYSVIPNANVKIIKQTDDLQAPGDNVFKTNKPEIGLRHHETCQTDAELELNSQKRISRIENNCKMYPQPKQINWARFGNGINNGYNWIDHVNPPEIWWSKFVVSEKLKAIYTTIEKSGSEEIKHALTLVQRNHSLGARSGAFQILREKYGKKGYYNGSLYQFGTITSLEIAKHVFDTYYKFVFFRDPLQRLYSGYIDKMVKRPSDDYIYWLRPFRKALRSQLKKASFKLFLQYVESQNDSSQFDHHFRPQVVIANPCEIKYNYIGLTNDVSCSLPYIFKKLYPASNVAPGKPRNSTRKWSEIIGENADLIRRVMKKHYQMDYDVLGFEFPSVLRDHSA